MALSISRKVKILYESLWLYRNAGHPDFEIVTQNWTKKTLLSRYVYSFLLLFKKLMQMRRIDEHKLNSSMILYVNSGNTISALDFLSDQGMFFSQISSTKTLGVADKNKATLGYQYSLLSIIQLPFAFFYYVTLNPKFALMYPDFFIENWGKLEWNIEYLKKQTNLRKVVFSNDHNVQNRLFLHACKLSNIHTSYIQHASVSQYFPPLNFDLSFLYGEVDYEKYKKIGGEMNKVELVGIPSFDPYKIHRKIIEKVKTIGLSINLIDDSRIIEDLALYLAKDLNIELIIRPHPRDMRVINFHKSNISYSNANEENSYSYLKKLDMHIAGDSSIHLESGLINVPSFYYKMSLDGLNDYYGFVQNDMIEQVTEKDYFLDLITKVNKGEYQSCYIRCKGFCASVDIEWEGKVGNRIKEILKNANTVNL